MTHHKLSQRQIDSNLYDMEVLKDYEKRVINLLTSNILSQEQLNEVIQNAELVEYDYTGCGYFLTMRHPFLSEDRIVCSEPNLIGEADGTTCGFVIFIENKELTIECHSWGEKDVPQEFRDKDVQVRAIVL